MTRVRRTGAPGWSRPHWMLGLALAAAVLADTGDLGAESWGGLTPGETMRAGVEALYGRPSRERLLVEEGQTVAEWTFAGDHAPRGLERMVISFGLMAGGRFVRDVVRAVTLYPKPRVFPLQAILGGWASPDAIGTEEATGRPTFHYRSRGLFIILDKTGSWAEFLLFGPRQPAGGS